VVTAERNSTQSSQLELCSGETDSDHEAVQHCPYNVATAQSNHAEKSCGAVGTACSKAEDFTTRGQAGLSLSPSAYIKTVLDRFIQHGSAIRIWPDQKGSVCSVLEPNGYVEEKPLQDILITLMMKDNCTNWYDHGQADDFVVGLFVS